MSSTNTTAMTTGGFGLTIGSEGLRVSFRISWGTYPAYLQRQVKLTVGQLVIVDETLTPASHMTVCAKIELILVDHPAELAELLAHFRQVAL